MDLLKHQGHRDSTRKNYHSIWKLFNHFFLRLDDKPLSWGERLILFVGFLIHSNKKVSTVNSYVSAIRTVLSEHGEEINEDKQVLKALTKACKLKNNHIVTRLPITRDLIEAIVRQMDVIHGSQPYLCCLFKAMFITAYYGLLRIGEVANSPHAIKACDIFVGANKDKLMLILRSSKTHTRGDKPQVIKISRHKVDDQPSFNALSPTESLRICPFTTIQNFIDIRKSFRSVHEPLFVYRDRTPVNPDTLRSTLHEAITNLGLDPDLYVFHLIRGGRANDLLRMGVEIEKIKKLGRWKSNAVYVYLR